MKNLFQFIILATLSTLLLSCENEENNAIAKAQKCLDTASQATASSCFTMVAGYDSQKANIIKCSAKFIEGGVDTDRLVTAYKQITDSTAADKTSLYFAYLAFSGGSASSVASEAKSYCGRTGVDGLVYLSNMAYAATALSVAAGGFTLTNATTLATELNTILDQCQDADLTVDTTCNTAVTQIAEIIPTVADVYCTGGNEDSDICTDINSAVDSYGSNMGQALLCLLDGKTPAANGTCS